MLFQPTCRRARESAWFPDSLIHDFVNNTANFNDPGKPYHRPKAVGGKPPPTVPGEEEPGPVTVPPEPPGTVTPREFKIIHEGLLDDHIRLRDLIVVGPEGLEIDRRTYQNKWKDKIIELFKADPAVQKIVSGEPLSNEEFEDLERRLNAPEYYFTLQSLRKAFEQPAGSMSDFIRTALGKFTFPTREDRIRSIFSAWVTEHSESMRPEQATMLRLLEQRVIAGDKVEMRLFGQPPFSLWGGRVRMEQLFGRDGLLKIVDELNVLMVA